MSYIYFAHIHTHIIYKYIHSHIHKYIHIHIHIYIHTYTYIQTYTHTYTHTYIHSHIHKYIHTYIYTYAHKHTYTHTYKHTHIHTYIYKHTNTYIHTYTHTYIHTFTYTHIYIHTRIHIYTHTYIHTYTHTYVIHTFIWLKFVTEVRHHRKIRIATGWMILGSNLGRVKWIFSSPECPDSFCGPSFLLSCGYRSFYLVLKERFVKLNIHLYVVAKLKNEWSYISPLYGFMEWTRNNLPSARIRTHKRVI
jgi:hypothetical protein